MLRQKTNQIKMETDVMDSKLTYKLAQIKNRKQSLFDDNNSISLNDILGSARCQNIISGSRSFRNRIFTPIKTLFCFIKQVLNPDKSCRNAVSDVAAEQLINEKKSVSLNTGPYCKARKRLPEQSVIELVKEVGASSAKAASENWKAFGRPLKGVDGTTVIMPDTRKNQEIFPQQDGQKIGIGFPIARIVVVMSLTVGTVLDYAIGPFKGKGCGESTLLRSIFGCIERDDILLGDRYYPSFFLMADVILKGADGIFRGQAQRLYDFRKGNQLDNKDHIVQWKRPVKPEWMDEKTYATYPSEMQVREFKVGGSVYVTTFLNNKKYHKKELAKLFELRWHLEINLKYIKEIMGMDMLSCKTPDMVMKEIGIHFLAYNFIRTIMAEACERHNAIPNKISFKGTVQLLNKFMPYFIDSSRRWNEMMYSELLKLIIQNRIGNRPGRVEPRAVKRRPKPFNTLNRPRNVERARLMRKIERRIAISAAA